GRNNRYFHELFLPDRLTPYSDARAVAHGVERAFWPDRVVQILLQHGVVLGDVRGPPPPGYSEPSDFSQLAHASTHVSSRRGPHAGAATYGGPAGDSPAGGGPRRAARGGAQQWNAATPRSHGRWRVRRR